MKAKDIVFYFYNKSIGLRFDKTNSFPFYNIFKN
jgi:hypothetical protein